MALQEERKRLSWSLMVALSLAIAGCGGESDQSGTANAASNQSDTASQDTRTPQPATPTSSGPEQTTTPDEPEKSVAEEEESPPPQIAQPGEVIENPIFADPIPVPIPEGERPNPDTSDGNTGKSKDKPADRDEPEVAKPEPEPEPKPEEPEPVAERPTLQWDSPLTRVDGSKLYPGEISGYRVYYRLRHQEEFESLVIDGPDTDSLTLDDFEPGAYEFAVSTLDVDGLESRRSDPVAVDLI